MRKLIRPMAKISFVGFAALCAAQWAIAQQPIQPAPLPGTVRPQNVLPGQPQDTFNAQAAPGPMFRGSAIIGSPVDLMAGTSLGTVRDLMLGPGGCVDYAVVVYQNQFIPIPWDLVNFEPGRRILMVNIDAARIRELPMVAQIGDIENGQFFNKVRTFYRGEHGFHRFNRGEQGRTIERAAPAREALSPKRAPENRGERR
jgi:PRC-barrel domain